MRKIFKTKVIVNPYSAFGETGKRWSTIKELIKARIKEFVYEFTEKPKDATKITKDALKSGFERLISVGGDGTLNEIVSGYFENNKPINENAFISILPSGKGNDFIKNFKNPSKNILSSDNEVKIHSVDSVLFTQPDGSLKRFINVASFGFSRYVVDSVLELREKVKSSVAYFWGVFKALKNFRATKIKLTIDGEALVDNYSIGAIANGKYFAGNMMISPQSSPYDGYLDLILLKEVSKSTLIYLLSRVYSGKHIKSKDVIVLKGKKIKVEPIEGELKGEYDGEIDIKYPAEFLIHEKSLKIGV